MICPQCGSYVADVKEYCAKHDKVREPGTECDLCQLDAEAKAKADAEAKTKVDAGT